MDATLDWFGCSTFRLTVGELVIFLDAYLDRVPGAQFAGLLPEQVDRADWIVVGLRMERSRLWCRISERVARMFERGLEEEIRRVRSAGVPAGAPGLSAIGYREAALVVEIPRYTLNQVSEGAR